MRPMICDNFTQFRHEDVSLRRDIPGGDFHLPELIRADVCFVRCGLFAFAYVHAYADISDGFRWMNPQTPLYRYHRIITGRYPVIMRCRVRRTRPEWDRKLEPFSIRAHNSAPIIISRNYIGNWKCAVDRFERTSL